LWRPESDFTTLCSTDLRTPQELPMLPKSRPSRLRFWASTALATILAAASTTAPALGQTVLNGYTGGNGSNGGDASPPGMLNGLGGNGGDGGAAGSGGAGGTGSLGQEVNGTPGGAGTGGGGGGGAGGGRVYGGTAPLTAPGGSGGYAAAAGGAGTVVVESPATGQGGASGQGGWTGQANENGRGVGGGGGGGGSGLALTASGSPFLLSGPISGGNGGAGGEGGYGGGGGGGGNGADLGAGTFTLQSAVTGGNGGAGGQGFAGASIPAFGGGGGGGGAGVFLSGGSLTVLDGASVTGGNGGTGGSSFLAPGRPGQGAVGITGTNASLTIGGAVTGGLSGGAGTTHANAIAFTSGTTNRLELWSSGAITGNVSAVGTSTTLALGGTANGSFDVGQIGATAKYQGFWAYEKTGVSTWALTGTTADTTAWSLLQGTLSIDSDANLGAPAGTLTINNDARLLARAGLNTGRTIVLGTGGGVIDTASHNVGLTGAMSGAGALTKAGTGTLTFLSAPSYAGTTTISSGTLEFRGSTGSLSGDMTNEGQVIFDQNAASSFSGGVSGSGSLVKRGSGNLTLSGPLGYGGSTDIEKGTLTLSGDTGALTGLIRNQSALVFSNSADTLLQTNIVGAGSLTKLGAGTLIFTGTSTLTGGTAVNGGAMQLGEGAFGSSLAGAVNVGTLGELNIVNTDIAALTRITNNGVLTFNGTATAGNLSVLNRGLTFFLDNSSAASASIDNREVLEFSDLSSAGSATLINRNNAIMAFQGNSAPANAVIINSGVVDFSGTSGTAGNNKISAAAISGSGQLYLGRNELTIGSTGQSTTLSGTINDGGISPAKGGSLVKAGAGTLTLTGANTYSGGTTIGDGTLAISSDASLGVASGDVTIDGAELQFNNGFNLSAGRTINLTANGGNLDVQNFDVTAPGEVAGAGALGKAGTGTLTLTGVNTYSGSTLVNNGALAIGGQGAIANSSGVSLAGGTAFDISAANGDVAVQSLASPSASSTVVLGDNTLILSGTSNDVSFAGSINGTGGLTKSGANTVTLSANPNYSGSTTVLDGTLQFAGPVSGLAAPILVDGNLTIANPFSNVLTAAVSGSGTLTQAGSGSLALTGINTYSGGTIIESGTVIAAVQNLGTGTITNDGALVIAQPVSAAFAGGIDGTGSVTKTGRGVLELTGSGSLSGPTQVQEGELKVNGTFAYTAVTLDRDTRLTGSGTVGGLIVNEGARVSPGNSIGTLHVAGNVLFAPRSIYDLDIERSGISDRIEARGRARLDGGTVDIDPDRGRYSLDPYTILVAARGVSGRFEGVDGADFAFLTPVVDYYSDRVTLTLERKIVPPGPDPKRFSSEATTANEFATAEGIENLGTGNVLFDTVVGTSVAGARQAFNALSGEIHASAVTSIYADDRLIESTILGRMRAAAPADAIASPAFDSRRFVLWGQALGSWAQTRSNRNAASLDASTSGFMIGGEFTLDDTYRLGAAGGFTRTSFDVDGRMSSGSNESVFGTFYGAAAWGAVNFTAGASYSGHDLQTDRTIAFPGFSDIGGASYDGYTGQVFGEVGYKLSYGAVDIQPFAGASALRLHTDSFREEGGPAALAGYARDHDLLTTTLGVQASARLSQAAPLSVTGLLGWRHAFGHVAPTSHLAFEGGASSFVVSGAPVDRNALVAEAGLNWSPTGAIQIGVAYSGQIGAGAQSHAFKGNLDWRF
jgi:outer membrane autotransporter protein